MTRRQWVIFGAVYAGAFVAGGTVAWLTYATIEVLRADEERQRG